MFIYDKQKDDDSFSENNQDRWGIPYLSQYP